MERLNDIELHPVFEITPEDFDEPLFPKGMSTKREEISSYYQGVLAKNKLANLQAVSIQFSFYRLDQMDDESLIVLLKHYLGEKPMCTLEDEAEKGYHHYFEKEPKGGVILTSNEKYIVTPQCCISFSDYKQWLNITYTETFLPLWIGHPWMYYKMKGEEVYFSRLIEKSFDRVTWHHYITRDNTLFLNYGETIKKTNKEINNEDIKYVLSYPDLQNAIEALKQKLDHFESRVKNALEKLGKQEPDILAHHFIRGIVPSSSHSPDYLE